MPEYVTNKDGKWEIGEGYEVLIEPSETYIQEVDFRFQQEEQERIERELMESLKPSEKEVLKAEIELNILELLIDCGVI